MRKVITVALAAAALVSAASLMSSPASAMTIGTPAGVLGAAHTINPVDNVACWRYGGRGWGWYPCYSGGYYGYGGWGHRPYWAGAGAGGAGDSRHKLRKPAGRLRPAFGLRDRTIALRRRGTDRLAAD